MTAGPGGDGGATVVAGRYELEELVGSGGMASVYRAGDRLLERRVAIKILHEHFARDGDAVERFQREARAVAQLAHPNIVTVIDRGEENGRPYIVFEYVEGETLKQRVQREGPLPVAEVITLGLEIARALEAAHARGVVHRDVKPQNVLLAEDGRARVTDFGIARARDTEGLTLTGTILGTSDYIPPEQARGERTSESGDIYSLGVVLFELLTGDVPYTGETAVAVAMRHVRDPVPSVLERRADVPPRVDALVQRSLAKDPAARLASMGEVVTELEACRAEAGAPAARGVPGSDSAETFVTQPTRAPRRRQRHAVSGGRGRRAVRSVLVALVTLLLVAGAAVGTFVLARSLGGSGDDGATTGGSDRPAVALTGIGAHDPFGGDGEHDAEAPNATDKDAATYWTTETYQSFDKEGVGVVVDAGKQTAVSRVTVQTDTPGFTAEIQAGAAPTGPFETVSQARSVAGTTTFTLEDANARYYVVWITDLGTSDVAHVNEVRARG